MTSILLKDLTPGTSYEFQVRAVGADDVSEWSQKFPLSTVKDTTPPDVPAGLTVTADGTSFIVNWTALNRALNQNIDFLNYELELVASGRTSVIKTANNFFVLTFEENRNLFLTPQASIVARIRAVDETGNASAWSATATTSNPKPSAPSSLTGTSAVDQIALKWTAVADNDVTGYRVYTGTTSGFTPSESNKIFDGNALSLVYTTTTYSDQWFKVAAVDVFGQTSDTPTATTAALRPNSPFVADTTAPALPAFTTASSNIVNNASGVGANARLVWTQTVPSPDDLFGFEIRFKTTGNSAWSSAGRFAKDDRTADVALQSAYTNYDFQIRSFDSSSNYSAWTATMTLTSPSNAAPANVTGLTASPGRDAITYKWTAVADTDIKNYEVTFSTSSTFASGNVQYLTGTATTLNVGGLNPSTTYYARVRAVDNGGLTSAAWSSTVSASTTAFPQTALSDGSAPASSPTPVITPGIGYLFAQWAPVSNADLVTYEVHISTTSGFTPSSSTKIAELAGTFTNINALPGGTALTYGTTYYIRLIAKDRDGAAAVGTQASGATLKVTANDSSLGAGDVGAPTTTQFNNLSGQVNASIKTYVTEYAVNASETTAPTSGWSTATPTRTAGSFIWVRTTVTYQDNSTSTTNPALLTGNAGAPGAAGTNGTNGTNGAPAATIDLTANAQVLTSPAAGGATNPTTATVTGTAKNTTISVYEYSVDGAAFSTTVPAGASRSGNVVTITGSIMTARTIAVRMADANGVADTLTVAKVADGAQGNPGAAGTNGTNGAAGADAYTVILTNEAQVFPGSTNAALAGSATSSVIAYKGGTQTTATIGTITGQVTGLTTTITNNGTNNATVTINVTTALTTQSGTLTVPVTVDGKSFTQLISWSVSYIGAAGARGADGAAGAKGDTGAAGTNGTNGSNGVSVTSITTYYQQVATGAATPATPTTNPPPSPWTVTEPTYAISTELYRTDRVLYSDGSFSYTAVSKSSSYAAAAAAQATADASIALLWMNPDPTFAKWSGVVPDGWTQTGTAPVKETSTVRTSNGALRWNVTAAGTQAYINRAFGNFSAEYIVVEVDVLLVSGTFAGTTLLVDWNQSSGNRTRVDLNLEIPNPVTNRWYRVTKVIKKPTSLGSTVATSFNCFLMGNWTSGNGGGSVKEIIFDKYGIRQATNEEITAFESSGTTDTKISNYNTTTVIPALNGKNTVVHSQSAPTTGNPNIAGDTWVQYDANNQIIAQFRGMGGNSWVSETINNQFIANLDAGKISANSTFTNNLNVKSTFTLGEVGTPGSIQTYDYAAGSAGFRLSSAGLEINRGIIRAPALVVAVGGGNLLSDGGFESGAFGTHGWTTVGTTNATFTNQDAISGSAKRVQMANAGSDTFLQPGAGANSILARIGTKYTLSAWVYKTSAVTETNNRIMSIEQGTSRNGATTIFVDGVNADGDNSTGVTYMNNTLVGGMSGLTAGVWTRIKMTFIARAAWISPRIYSSNTSGTIYWDNIQLEEGELPTTFSPKADEILPGTISGNMLQATTAIITTLNIGTNGLIQSSNYNAANATGWRLSELGLDIRQGTVAANTLVAGTGIVNNLVVNGGAVQSNDYSATAGYRLSSTGLEINSSGSSVKVDALKTGTLGASGAAAIQVANGTSLVFNSGHLRSNTYQNSAGNQLTSYSPSTATAGWYLGNDGLNIVQGAVSVATLTSGTISTTGSIVLSGANTTIQSANYSTTSGFRLTQSGLDLPDGYLSASKLNVQFPTPNLIPAAFADFEFVPSWYTGKITTANVTWSIDSTLAWNNADSFKITTAAAAPYIVFASPATNTSMMKVNPGQTYIVSLYYNGASGAALNMRAVMRYSTSGGNADASGGNLIDTVTGTAGMVADGTWRRAYAVVTIPAATTGQATLYFDTLTQSRTWNIDGLQIEEKVGNLNTPSRWTPPGFTSVDGGQVITGSIQSTQPVTVNGNTVPAWSINTQGYATFAGAQILGNTLIGNGASDTTTRLASTNYVAGSAGWMLRGDGYAELRQLAANIIGVNELAAGAITTKHTITGAVLQTAASGQRVMIDLDGFKAYSSSALVTSISSATGKFVSTDVDISGTITSGLAQFRSSVVANNQTGNAPAVRIGNTAAAHLRVSDDRLIAMDSDTTQGMLYLNVGGETSSTRMIIDSVTDASTAAGNKPPLRVGSPTAQHLRVDNNEIISMSNDSTQTDLILNAGGQIRCTNINVSGTFNGVTKFNNAIYSQDALTLRVVNSSNTQTGELQIGGGSNIRGKIMNTGRPTGGGVALTFLDTRVGVTIESMNATDFSSANTQSFVANQITAFNGLFDNSLVRSNGTQNQAAYLTPGGRLSLTAPSSSTSRIKQDIKRMKIKEARRALNLNSYTFRYKDDVAEFGDSARTNPGVIAEQAEKVGLDRWVLRDEEDKASGFKYAELTVAHNMLIKELYTKNEELEKKNSDLEARLARLEALVESLV